MARIKSNISHSQTVIILGIRFSQQLPQCQTILGILHGLITHRLLATTSLLTSKTNKSVSSRALFVLSTHKKLTKSKEEPLLAFHLILPEIYRALLAPLVMT